MTLLERASALRRLGFLPGVTEAELPGLVHGAEEETGIDPGEAPATAILVAAGVVLEIGEEDITDPEDYVMLLADFAHFLSIPFDPDDVDLAVEEADPDAAIEPGAMNIHLEYSLGDTDYTSTLQHAAGVVDFAFLHEFEDYLERKGEKRRPCSLVELVDDVARFLFVDPEVLEKAEIEEVIAAPDFEIEE